MSLPGTNWENFEQTDGTGLFAGNDTGPTPTNTPVSIPPLALGMVDYGLYYISWFYFTGEHCEENDPEASYSYGWFPSWGWNLYEDDQTYTRHAQTTMQLQAGGRAVPGRRSLFQISGWAKDLEAVLSKRAAPPYVYFSSGGPTTLDYAPYLPYSTIRMGSLGTLDGDGNLWVTLPDGGTPVDVTPQTGKPFYLFGADQQKYVLTITANTTNLDNETPEFCVGQDVFLSANWSPSLPDGTQKSPIWWTLDGTLVNESYYPSGCTTCSQIYTNDPNVLTNEYFDAWWVSGDCDNPPAYRTDVRETLTFANGQYVNIAAIGKIKMYRPKIVSFSPSTSTAVVLDTSSDIYLGLGQPGGGGSKQMYWDMTIKENPAFSGWISNVQLVDCLSHHDDTYDPDTDGDFWLDNSDPYGVPLHERWRTASSSPTINIFHADTPGIEGNYTSVAEDSDNFWTYVQFQPDGGIPVTIGIVTWGWHGKATADGSGVWSLNIQDITSPFLYPDDDTFPEWPNTYYNSP